MNDIVGSRPRSYCLLLSSSPPPLLHLPSVSASCIAAAQGDHHGRGSQRRLGARAPWGRHSAFLGVSPPGALPPSPVHGALALWPCHPSAHFSGIPTSWHRGGSLGIFGTPSRHGAMGAARLLGMAIPPALASPKKRLRFAHPPPTDSHAMSCHPTQSLYSSGPPRCDQKAKG